MTRRAPLHAHVPGLLRDACVPWQNDLAMDMYRKAVTIKPNFAEAHCNLGLLLKGAGDVEGARHCQTQALRLRPDFAAAWKALGALLRDCGDVGGAIACYRVRNHASLSLSSRAHAID